MDNIKKAVFAGGCFWCMVKPFDCFDGVLKVTSGYTGGHLENPSYEDVLRGNTGHVEAVEVIYNEDKVSYEDLLEAFFMSIDPTDDGGQFNDRGESYKTAVFYEDDIQREKAMKYIEVLDEKRIFPGKIVTRVLKAKKFYEAESYHQDYYKKNGFRYKMYYKGSGRKDFLENIWSTSKKSKEQLKNELTPLQFKVTQENGTEPPYNNEFDDNFSEGIYVDLISGKPLFSSRDKYNSSCGWPAFTKPINKGYIKEKQDLTHGMIRREVRSRNSDSHLGHVFTDGPKEEGGLRYCINSAALKFIPKEEMESKGYKDYLKYI